MSAHARLVCDATREYIFLGKPIRANPASLDRITSFWLGRLGDKQIFEDEQMNRLIWTFLAKTAGHSVRIHVDTVDDFAELEGYSEIGGDEPQDISYERFLRENSWK